MSFCDLSQQNEGDTASSLNIAISKLNNLHYNDVADF